MKKKAAQICFILMAVAMMGCPVFADLGLVQLANQGASQVGQVVLDAARAVFANSDLTPAEKQEQLTAMLNEAVTTGNEAVIRYAIVAIMMAGGAEGLPLAITAINNSDAFSQYESMTALTVTAVSALMGGGVAGGEADGGNAGGGGDVGGGGQLGGGSFDEFIQSLGLETLTGPDANEWTPVEQPVTPT